MPPPELEIVLKLLLHLVVQLLVLIHFPESAQKEIELVAIFEFLVEVLQLLDHFAQVVHHEGGHHYSKQHYQGTG